MKKLLIGAGLVAIFALMPSSQIYSQDASVSCEDCQYRKVDKSCYKVEVSFGGGFSGSIKSGSRVSCNAGSGNCSSTSCS